jgi:hypothetical protein
MKCYREQNDRNQEWSPTAARTTEPEFDHKTEAQGTSPTTQAKTWTSIAFRTTLKSPGIEPFIPREQRESKTKMGIKLMNKK